eukprot:scaffold5833_cov165-Amphora_coffeaeformis.AAC.4
MTTLFPARGVGLPARVIENGCLAMVGVPYKLSNHKDNLLKLHFSNKHLWFESRPHIRPKEGVGDCGVFLTTQNVTQR